MEATHFEGFDNPEENWSKLPHSLIEALPLIETVSEFKVIAYILRHTWGFKDEEKRITLDEFANGRKRREGTRLDNGTGLTIPSIRNGLKRAIEHGFIEHHQDATDKARVKNFYSLKMKQGEKLLHPECKEDSGSGKKSLPRTEKETLETNPRKEKREAPTLREQAKAGEMTTETELALLTGFGRHGQAGVADPSQDIQAYMQTADQFLSIYHDKTGLWPDTNVQKPAIQELATDPRASPELWDQVVTAWVGVGWNKRNVTGMIDCYQRGEIPTTKKNGGKHATNHQSRRVPGRVPEYSVADPAAYRGERQDDEGPGPA